MKYLLLFLMSLGALTSCNQVKDSAKEVINEGGEIVGKSIGEFGKGLSEGIDESLEVKIQLSEELSSKGIQLGKIDFHDDTLGTDNVLSVYIISNQAFNGTLSLKIFDKNDLEMGRSFIELESLAGHAQFYDFHFDHRSNIDSDSKIIME